MFGDFVILLWPTKDILTLTFFQSEGAGYVLLLPTPLRIFKTSYGLESYEFATSEMMDGPICLVFTSKEMGVIHKFKIKGKFVQVSIFIVNFQTLFS